jgi:hypothetical protein
VERLDDFPSEDLVSGVVRDLRVHSTVFCRSELRAPWGFAVGPRDLAAFHVVLAGECRLEVDGIEGGAALASGDLVILLRGQAHTVRDRSESAVSVLDDLLAAGGFDGYELRHGGDGELTELLCGGFVVGGGEASGLLPALPAFLVIRGEAGRPVAWLGDVLRC